MSHQARATRISLLLHILAALIVIYFTHSASVPAPVMAIDLSLLPEEVVQPSPPPEPPPAPPEPEPPKLKPKKTVTPEKKQPTPVKQQKTPPQPVAFEPGDSPTAVPVPEVPSPPPDPAAAPFKPVSSQLPPAPLTAVKNGLPPEYAYIRGIITRNLKFPMSARRQRLSGAIIVAFFLAKDGHAEEITIVKSSGHEVLDEAVRDAIRRSSPFPHPPAPARLRLPIAFKLQ
ncbi:MAG TPA: hypothetical protein DEB25_04390 [Desulfobulbaceae bacterium]|nr:hypothetical protein [Desulfobulbaceae bacterium]